MDLSTLSTVSRYLLSFQFLSGAQSRLLPQLTPELSKIPYSNADGFRLHLPIIPSSNSIQHTRAIGWLCGISGALLLIPRSKSNQNGISSVLARIGDGLAFAIPAMFLWAHVKIGLNPALPLFNIALVSLMWLGRGSAEYAA